jgi:hypothetical protein
VAKFIAILEDNHSRLAVMREWLADRLPMYETKLTDDPPTLIDWLGTHGDDVLALSLDHDLHERADGNTELTGMMVVDYLVQVSPTFPILLHTTNERDGFVMHERLTGAGWRVKWVKPFDDTNWIGADWYPTLKKLLQHNSPRTAPVATDVD